jgi:WD40 repeat protein
MLTRDGYWLKDVRSGAKRRSIDAKFMSAFAPDGKRLLTGNGHDFVVLDVESGKQIAEFLGRNGRLSCLALSPEGRFAASGHSEGNGIVTKPREDLFLYDLKQRKIVGDRVIQTDALMAQAFFLGPYRILPERLKEVVPPDLYYRLHSPLIRDRSRFESQEDVLSLEFSSDGRRLICGRSDGTARILDIVSGREKCFLRGHEGSVWSAKFSPDGRSVITAGHDGCMKMWATCRPELPFFIEAKAQRCLSGHDGPIYCAAFSPNGRHVVSGGADKTVRLWNVATGKQIASFDMEDGVTSVTFVGDDKMVAASSGSCAISTWKIQD